MSERPRKEVKEIPKNDGYTGLTVSRKPIAFTPNILLDKLGAPEENRPVFMITPMTIEQRNMVDGDNSLVKTRVALWAKENNIEINKFSDMHKKDSKGEVVFDKEGFPVLKESGLIEQYIAYQSMFEYYSDKNLKAEIVRKNITAVISKDKNLKFIKDEDGFLSESEFKFYHPELIAEIFEKILSISNPNQAMILGL